MWIKVVLIAALTLLAGAGMRAPRGARHLAMRRIGLVAFAVFAVTSVLFPSLWNWLARQLGVGRGTDLLLYGLVLAFLGYIANSYQRFRGMETQITRLARRIALDEVLVPPLDERAPQSPRTDGAPDDVVDSKPRLPSENGLDTLS